MTRVRNSVRALLVLSCLPLTALLTVPALAAGPDTAVPDTAYDAGPGLTVPETLGIFVGIPLLVMGVIFFAVYYVLFRLVIRWWNLRTPGREPDDEFEAEQAASGYTVTKLQKSNGRNRRVGKA